MQPGDWRQLSVQVDFQALEKAGLFIGPAFLLFFIVRVLEAVKKPCILCQ
jgi:hypothetical protein